MMVLVMVWFVASLRFYLPLPDCSQGLVGSLDRLDGPVKAGYAVRPPGTSVRVCSRLLAAVLAGCLTADRRSAVRDLAGELVKRPSYVRRGLVRNLDGGGRPRCFWV